MYDFDFDKGRKKEKEKKEEKFSDSKPRHFPMKCPRQKEYGLQQSLQFELSDPIYQQYLEDKN